MKLDPETIDVSIEELERVVEGARHQTLNDEDHRKLRGAVETLGQMARMLADKDATLRQLRRMLLKPATTEKTRAVLERAGILPQPNGKPGEPAAEKRKRQGHGRKPASAFVGALKVEVKHPTLQPGDPCPECGKGKVYRNRRCEYESLAKRRSRRPCTSWRDCAATCARKSMRRRRRSRWARPNGTRRRRAWWRC